MKQSTYSPRGRLPRAAGARKKKADVSTTGPRGGRWLELLEARQVLAAPTLAGIPDQTLLAGAPLHIPLDGFDADGDTITFTAESDNNDVTTFIPEGNRSLRLSVENTDPADPFTGDMVFELFDGRAPEAAGRIADVVEAGLYDGIRFHRIAPDFVIQTGDTGLPPEEQAELFPLFDDVFNPDLQHTSSGLLSFAKAGDDTNGTQIFVTDFDTRFLDFNHMVFGRLVEGDDIRERVQNVPIKGPDPGVDVDPTDDEEPVNDVIITEASIFVDNENGVLTISAPQGTTGTAEITVTASDGNGGTVERTFTVTIEADPVDNRPFLPPFEDEIVTTPGTAVTLDLELVDVDGGSNVFDAIDFLNDTATLAVEVIDDVEGIVRVTPDPNVRGIAPFIVAVRQEFVPEADSSPFDTQFVTLTVGTVTPTIVEPEGGVITPEGRKTDLNNEAGKEIGFVIEDAIQGATLTLFANGVEIGNTDVPGPAGDEPATFTSVFLESNGSVTIPDGPVSFTVTQTFGGETSEESNTIEAIVDSTAPTFSTTPSVEVAAGLTFSYDADTDEEGDFGFTYELTSFPTGMTIDADTGEVVWDTSITDVGTHTVTIRATDVVGNARDQTFQLEVTNTPPVIDSMGESTLDELSDFSVTATASDANEPTDSLTFFLEDAPAGMSINPTTGEITWTPAEDQGPGVFTVTVGVRDIPGAEDRTTLEVTVREVNQDPVLEAIDDQLVNLGETITVDAIATDADIQEQGLTFRLLSPPPEASIDLDGKITIVTDGSTVGPISITVEVEDSEGGTDETTFSVAINEPPALDPVDDKTVDEESTLSFVLTATDDNLPVDELTFALVDGPPGASVDATSGEFSFTPSESQGQGVFDVTVSVTDVRGLSDDVTFQITVAEVNRAPAYDPVDDQQVTLGETLSVQTSASDPDLPAQDLTFSLVSGPDGAAIDPDTGLFTWTPESGIGAGPFTVTLKTEDADGAFDEVSFDITLSTPPEFAAVDDQTIDEESTLTLDLVATDANLPADTLTFELVTGPSGASVDALSGQFTFTPDETQGPGVFDVTVRVTDIKGLEDEVSFQVTVNEANRSPVFAAIDDRTLTLGDTLEIATVATDADVPAQSLTFSLVDGPVGASIDATTGVFTYTPVAGFGGGPFTVTLRVEDSLGGFDEVSFDVSVRMPPVLDAIADRTIDELTELALSATVRDENGAGESFTFSFNEAPPGATIDESTGSIRWTPTEAQGPGEFDFTVGVEDSTGLVDTTTFTVTVSEINIAPRLDPVADREVEIGEDVVLTLSAEDDDLPAQTLKFSIADGPPGATIDEDTGEFRYTPDDSDVPAGATTGTFDVTIEATDDSGAVGTTTFAITVTRPPAPVPPVVPPAAPGAPGTLGFLPAFAGPERRGVAPAGDLAEAVNDVFNPFALTGIDADAATELTSTGSPVVGTFASATGASPFVGGAPNFTKGPDTGVAHQTPPPGASDDGPEVRGQDDEEDEDDQEDSQARQSSDEGDQSAQRRSSDNDGPAIEDAANDAAVQDFEVDTSSLIFDRLIHGISVPLRSRVEHDGSSSSHAEESQPTRQPTSSPSGTPWTNVVPIPGPNDGAQSTTRPTDREPKHSDPSFDAAWAPLAFLPWVVAEREAQRKQCEEKATPAERILRRLNTRRRG